MNNLLLVAALAILAGAAIALQSALNSQLGMLLNSPLMASSIAFILSGIFSFSTLLLLKIPSITLTTVETVPLYLWFTGSLFSAFGVSIFFYLAPKIGLGSLMSYALGGQIIMAIIISHFGWFNLPIKPLSITKVLGVVTLVMSITMINYER
ncbi:DMT family transporter [Colwellia sp. UCD-KL20]|uniref:DMT family transporter n=1 Tax=Colwellia sp. UCD-KL20 TaxID=1917165 RepID=UPI0009705420|nr:DMT family transporter [Colwellia sp. UCD-KL20]